MNYRKAKLEDLPRLLELEQRVIDAERPFDTSIKQGKPVYYDIPDLITNSNALLMVAEDDGRIIGTGYAQIRRSKATLDHDVHSYLGFMYVSSHHRRKGINSYILDQLIEWSKQEGVRHIYLEVYSQNSSAVRAYEKAGFESSVLEMKLITQASSN